MKWKIHSDSTCMTWSFQGVFRFRLESRRFFQLNQKPMVENECWWVPAQRFRSSRSQPRLGTNGPKKNLRGSQQHGGGANLWRSRKKRLKWRDVGKEELGHKKKKDTHPGKFTCNRYQNGGGFGQMTLFFQLG